MPRLFDDDAPTIERRVAPPVKRVPGPHRYHLIFDGQPDQIIVAESAADAVALREGARAPHTINDLTELDAWVARRIALQQAARLKG